VREQTDVDQPDVVRVRYASFLLVNKQLIIFFVFLQDNKTKQQKKASLTDGEDVVMMDGCCIIYLF
jgi:hypothetical protein